MRRYVTPSAQASDLRPSRVSHGSSVSPQEATYSNHSKRAGVVALLPAPVA